MPGGLSAIFFFPHIILFILWGIIIPVVPKALIDEHELTLCSQSIFLA